MSEVLKSCPFCGGQAMERKAIYEGEFSYVYCPTCGVRTNQELSIKDAIDIWNQRNGEDDKHNL